MKPGGKLAGRPSCLKEEEPRGPTGRVVMPVKHHSKDRRTREGGKEQNNPVKLRDSITVSFKRLQILIKKKPVFCDLFVAVLASRSEVSTGMSFSFLLEYFRGSLPLRPLLPVISLINEEKKKKTTTDNCNPARLLNLH